MLKLSSLEKMLLELSPPHRKFIIAVTVICMTAFVIGVAYAIIYTLNNPTPK